MSRTIAITGTTGFIGSHLMTALLEDGWSVRALIRHPPPPGDHGVEWVTGDLDDRDALHDLVQGAQAVVHCAGRVRGRTAAQFDHVNAEGTENLVSAATEQPTWPRFLLLSSLAARQPKLSWYAASKRRAEELLLLHGDAMPWTILRPTAVYGPGDREMLGLFKAMRRGLLPVPGDPAARITLIHVKDLVEAILCWARADTPPRGRFELHDGTPDGYGWADLTAIAATAWRRPVRRLPIPSGLLRGAAWVNLGLARLLGYDPMLTPGKVRELRHPDWRCDNTHLTQAVGWSPRITLLDSLRGDMAALT
ncbi:MAG: NAD-dependent epimerase/dehydratase family protein [Gammaproteobacteria bacterium]|nr:NAD-dependent epimerase/dehydratase family protein [Gammaproteobacteria bacterium]